MRRIAKVVAVTALVLSVVGAGVFIGSLRIGEQEHPPCHACTQMTSDVRPVTVCELSNNRQKYEAKSVRVIAEFQNDAGELFLKAGGCKIPAVFAKERQACNGAWRKMRVASGFETWYDGSASVRVVGFVSAMPDGNDYAGEAGFTISCLEEAQTKPGFGKRARFALGRLFGDGR